MRPKAIIYARTQTPRQNPAHPRPPTTPVTERAREAASSLDANDRGQSNLAGLLIGFTTALVVGVTITNELFSSMSAAPPVAAPTPISYAAPLLVLLGFVLLTGMLAASHSESTDTQESDRLEYLKTQYVEGELSQLEYEARVYDHWEEETDAEEIRA